MWVCVGTDLLFMIFLCVEFVYLCMCVGVFIDVCVGHLHCTVNVCI